MTAVKNQTPADDNEQSNDSVSKKDKVDNDLEDEKLDDKKLRIKRLSTEIGDLRKSKRAKVLVLASKQR